MVHAPHVGPGHGGIIDDNDALATKAPSGSRKWMEQKYWRSVCSVGCRPCHPVRRQPLKAGWAMLKAHFRGNLLFSYDQTKLADYILAYRRVAQHWKATLPQHTFMDASYEDIEIIATGISLSLTRAPI
jgi:hypothetical protein